MTAAAWTVTRSVVENYLAPLGILSRFDSCPQSPTPSPPRQPRLDTL